jgi:predicted Zn-dependent protease
MQAQLLAAQALVLGDRAGAASILDDLLAEQPTNIAALEFKGDLLAEAGKTAEALDAYNLAIKAFYQQNESPEEAPTMLARKQHEMMDKLLDQ